MQYGDPVWVDRPKYGEVKEFMRATWKGKLLQLAIIETWDTEAWGPHAFARERTTLVTPAAGTLAGG